MDQYEESRRRRIHKRLSQVPKPTDEDFNRVLFSRHVSEVGGSTEMDAILAANQKLDGQKVTYSNKVMKKIFAQQILNKEHIG